MLTDLHSVLRRYPGRLPDVCADVIPGAMAPLDDAGDVLSAAEVVHTAAGAAGGARPHRVPRRLR